MKKITCLYDRDDWAIFNLLEILKNKLSDRFTFELVNYKEFYKDPYKTDILYITFLFLFKKKFDYRKYASKLICTIHDPSEISNFVNKVDWEKYPLRKFDFSKFDRVSSITKLVQKIVVEEYGMYEMYYTPTLSFFKSEENQSDQSQRTIRVFASTNVSGLHSLKDMLRRIKNIYKYVFDQKGRFSFRQLRSLFILETRKNIKLLKKIKTWLAAEKSFADDIRYGKEILERDEYLERVGSADIYICTSFMEGGPIPLAEAAARGSALLSTKVGQVEEILLENENGFFCSSYYDFISKLEYYKNNPQILAEHKRSSKSIMDNLEDNLHAWERFFNGQ